MAVSIPFKLVKVSLALLATIKRKDFIDSCKNPAFAQARLKEKLGSFPEKPSTYQDYENLKTPDVIFYETTSGSTGTKKKIPYTKALLKSFENMFLLWAHDLVFHSGLGLKSGKFFMSVSPQIGDTIKDDRQYLSPVVNWLLNPFLASNPNEHKARTSEEFLMKISQDLLKARDLEIISIWSPTYFLSVLDFMETHRLVENPNWEKIWPELKLISCWTSAQAELSARALQKKFPHVKVQGKGLLLTEAPITIPWSEAGGDLPLVNETYLEFLDHEGRIHPLHEIKRNHRYIVLTSTPNGFLRYNTLDEVEVTGFYYQTPVLKFLGRTGGHSDLAGEKLSESILRQLFSFPLLLVPNQEEALPFYEAYTEEFHEIEKGLRENYHYNLARELNQLREVKIIKLQNLRQKYLEFFQSQGMQLGDIKERTLINDSLLAQKFREWIGKGR